MSPGSSPGSSPRSSKSLSMENSLVIIPARHAARRFPGKMLASLNGRFGGRSVIEYSWCGARLAGVLARRLPSAGRGICSWA